MDVKVEERWFIIPKCCGHKKYLIVFLDYLWEEVRQDKIPIVDIKPRWVVVPSKFDLDITPRVEVFYCPTCGKKLPEIIKRPINKLPKKISSSNEGYCDVCKERIRNCECHPPHFFWEPVE